MLDAVLGTGRARGRLARAAEAVPLTARGAWLALACALALEFVGRGQRDLVVLVLATSGLGAVGLAALLVGLGALRLRAALARGERAQALRIEVGRSTATGFSLPALRWLALLRVALAWPDAPEVECEMRRRRGRLEEWIRARRRFERVQVRRAIALEDVFGLARVTLESARTPHVTALPAAGPGGCEPLRDALAAGGEVESARGAAEGDRFDLRRYQPGDPARHILWRSFARSRELFVRAPERAAAPARRVAAYLICDPEDEPAAAAARAALESGALGRDWRFGADGCSEQARGLAEALRLLARSGNAQGGHALERFAAHPDAAHELLLVFAPAHAGPWVAMLEEVARARGGGTALVLALDAQALRVRRWRRAERRRASALEMLRARLARSASVVVVTAAAGAGGAAAALASLEARG